MQVSSNTVSHQKTSLERQKNSNETTSYVKNIPNNSKTIENGNSLKSKEVNETSQYLKVLTRVENLLHQNKLPDAAIEGFIGAIKSQIELISEDEKQMILKLPEAVELDLKNLENLPEIIKDNIREEDELPKLLKFLKLPKFAELMQSESKNPSKIYKADASQIPQKNKAQGLNILDIPKNDQKQANVELNNSVKNMKS